MEICNDGATTLNTCDFSHDLSALFHMAPQNVFILINLYPSASPQSSMYKQKTWRKWIQLQKAHMEC